MIRKIGIWIRNHLFNHYDCCYTDKEYKGIASMGCCSGVVGGTSSTEYLSEMCIGCPHYVTIKS